MLQVERLHLSVPDTAEQLWALQHAAYREEAKRIGVSDLPPLRDTIASLQACRETFYGCYNEDGELIGAVSTEEEAPGKTVICRMMVRPDQFRQGIGSRLLRHVIGAAEPSSELTVTSEIRNEPALRLYEGHGFRRVSTFSPAPDIQMVLFTLPVDESVR
ncbi:GNAT family N-acetyltransferase [Cohnella pontilimi]|uniref:GNAT family N-acetyltransferase n=1 Tax=Cohnella pontilimi TaxID=2564100 RepID=A0A4U0F244_9BACL|nr:GNAT family N-acetyltransferase [Cohnella pontilimi]TJY38527.1 GNAT family N-acetyltransferase [Cohnella pontilimi]